jgi:rod shape-determining protein MreC
LGGTLRSGAQSVFSPVQGLLSSVTQPVVDLVDGVANLAGLREENAALRQELQEMRDRVARTEELQAQVDLLEEAQNLDLQRDDLTRVSANVVGGGDPLDLSFTIDKGTENGILVGNPAIDTQGNVVGLVTDVFSGSARIIPLVAQTETAVVTVGDQEGVVTGLGNPGMLDLMMLEADSPVKQGDLVVTGNTESYPAGLSVGAVAADVAPESSRIFAELRPLADFERLRLVVVLGWPLAEDDQPTDTTAPETGTGTTVPTVTTVGGDG